MLVQMEYWNSDKYNREVKIISIVIRMSEYDSAVGDSDVFLSLSSCGYYHHWLNGTIIMLFNVSKPSIYLIVLLNLLASIKLVLIIFLIYLYS